MKSGCCFLATPHTHQKRRWRVEREMQTLSQVQSQPTGEIVWERFQEALGLSMLHPALTKANLKSTCFLRAALAPCGISFFLIKLKKMPQENTVKETIKTVETCFDRGCSGRLHSSFINNPTLTCRNALYVISVSCGNSQDTMIYQLWFHLWSASTDLAWFYFPFRLYSTACTWYFSITLNMYPWDFKTVCFSRMHVSSPSSLSFHAHLLLILFNFFLSVLPRYAKWKITPEEQLLFPRKLRLV